MNTENLSTLKIHRLTQAQYDRELEAGRIDPSAIYLTPDEEIAKNVTGVTSGNYLVGNGTGNMIEKTPDEVWSHIKSAGKNVTGKSYVVGGKNVTAGLGAEVFNVYTNIASGAYSHAEGYNTIASGTGSHAEGYTTTASNNYSHAEGYNATASGAYTHAEGYNTVASGGTSHAEGSNTNSSGICSHAEGLRTIANGNYQHVQGQYNIANANLAHIIGNGASDTSRSNAHTIDWKGNAWFAGNVECDNIILLSPNGTRFKVSVSDTGVLSTSKVT